MAFALATGQATDDRVGIRLGEERHGVAVDAQWADHPMRCGLVPVVAPARHHVADIDHEGPLYWRRIEPFAAHILHLQAASLVLIEQGDAAVIGMRAGPLLLGCRCGLAWGIVDHAEHADRLDEALIEKARLDAERISHGAQEGASQRMHVSIMLLEQRFPAFQIGMAIRPAQRLACQDVRMIGRHVETHVEGLLQIAGLAGVELLGRNRAVTAVVSAFGDVDLQLLLDRQRKELFGRILQLADTLSADRMIADIEKAPVTAGRVDLSGDLVPAVLVRGIERRDVDNGEWCAHG